MAAPKKWFLRQSCLEYEKVSEKNIKTKGLKKFQSFIVVVIMVKIRPKINFWYNFVSQKNHRKFQSKNKKLSPKATKKQFPLLHIIFRK
jgi:hypothetical protein